MPVATGRWHLPSARESGCQFGRSQARLAAALASLAASQPAAQEVALAPLSLPTPPPPITALIALPGAGAAIVLAPGATHVYAESGVMRAVLVEAVQAELA